MLPEILLILAIGLAVVTVVGHLLWLAIATFMRNVFGTSLPPRSPARDAIEGSQAQIKQDLRAFRRILEYLHWKGWILSSEKDRFLEVSMRVQNELENPKSSISQLLEQREEGPTQKTSHTNQTSVTTARPLVIAPPQGSTTSPKDSVEEDSFESLHRKASALRNRIDQPRSMPTPSPHISADRTSPEPTNLEHVESTDKIASPRDFEDSLSRSPITQPPRRALSEVLQSFLIEHNIRWGELAAGILIVVCSAGLVMSLWSKLTETNRLIPAGIFLTAVAAIESAGLYTLRRWKLRHTSRAVLIIATMLIPLAMMAGISIAASGDNPVRLTNPATLTAVVVGGCTCIGLLYLSGSALVRKPLRLTWTWTIGIPTALLPFASALAFSGSGYSKWLMLTTAITVSTGLLSEANRLRRRSAPRFLLPMKRNQRLLLVAIAAYAIAIFFAMFVLRGQRDIVTLIPLALAAVPCVVAIASMAQLLAARIRPGGFQLAAKSFGWFALLSCLALMPVTMKHFEWITAWSLLVAVSGVLAGTFTEQKWPRFLLPIAAMVWLPLAVSIWVAGNEWNGDIALWRRYVSGQSTVAILFLATLFAAMNRLLRDNKNLSSRKQLSEDQVMLGMATFAITTVGIALACIVGLGPTDWLDSIPRPLFTVIIATAAGIACYYRGDSDFGRKLSQILLALSISSLFFNAEVWKGQAFEQIMPALALTLSLLSMGCAIFAELSARNHPSSLKPWWHEATTLGCIAVVAAVLTHPLAPLQSCVIAGSIALLTLLAAWRTDQHFWLTASYLCSALAIFLTTRHYQPLWLTREATWTSTHAPLYITAIAAITLTTWSLLRDTLSFFVPSIQKIFDRDTIALRHHASYLTAIGFAVLIIINLGNVFHAHAKSTQPLLPGFDALLWSTVSIALLGLSRNWPFVPPLLRMRSIQTLIAKDRGHRIVQGKPVVKDHVFWTFVITLLPSFVLGLASVYWLGISARGMVSLGWISVIVPLAFMAINCGVRWVSFPIRDAFNQIASILICFTVGGASWALLSGAHGFRLSGHESVYWLPETIAAWTLVSIAGWYGLACWTHRTWPTSLTAVITAISPYIIAKWFFCEASIETLLAAPCAGLLTLYWVDQTITWSGVKRFLSNREWESTQAETHTSHSWIDSLAVPIQFGAAIAIASAFAIAAKTIPTGLIDPTATPNPAWIWTLICGMAAVTAGHYLRRRASWWVITSLGCLVTSGLLTSCMIQWNWIGIQDYPLSLAILWLVPGIAIGARGIHIKSPSSIFTSFAIGIVVITFTSIEDVRSYPWLTVGVVSALWNSALGLFLYRRLQIIQLGQIAALTSAAGLALTVVQQMSLAWPANGPFATGVILFGLGLLWRFIAVYHIAAPNKSLGEDSRPAAQSNTHQTPFDQFPSQLWVDNAFFGSVLACFLPIFFQTLEEYDSVSLGRLVVVIAALGVAVLSTLVRLNNASAVVLAYLSSQIAVILCTIRLLPENVSVETVSVLTTIWVAVSALWVWNWPLSRVFIERFGQIKLSTELNVAHSLPCRSSLTVLQLGSLLSTLVLSCYVMYARFDSISFWLVLCSAAGMATLVGNLADWFDSYRPAFARYSMALRYTSSLSLVAILLLNAFHLSPEQHPEALMICMRLLVLSIFIPPLAIWVIPKALKLASTPWSAPLRASAIAGMAAGAIALPLMFVNEWSYRGTETIEQIPTTLVIGVGLIIGMGSLFLAFAGLFRPNEIRVLPPLADSQRRIALYAAQVLAGLAWFHVYLCRPELALTELRPYWPYVVMGIAFISAGLSHWGVTRQDLPVSETMKQTSLFLPLIPAIGFWLSNDPSVVWTYLSGQVSYATLLIFAACFYGFLAFLWSNDRIPRYAGIIMANAALWVVLVQYPSLRFFDHPQFWLIPPSLCVLGVLQFDRERLPSTMLAPIRYACVLVIYISSTADVILSELGATLLGPIILILLALAGMLAGVVLRTRAYLYLGTLFVLVGVLSMVWNAGRAFEQNWPWWVFGITTGCLILGGLMAIEKNKPKIRGWIQTLNGWEP